MLSFEIIGNTIQCRYEWIVENGTVKLMHPKDWKQFRKICASWLSSQHITGYTFSKKTTLHKLDITLKNEETAEFVQKMLKLFYCK